MLGSVNRMLRNRRAATLAWRLSLAYDDLDRTYFAEIVRASADAIVVGFSNVR
jgi:hypothetical protein